MKDEKIIITELKRLGHSVVYKEEDVIVFKTFDGAVSISYAPENIELGGGPYIVQGAMSDTCETTSNLMSAIRNKCNWSAIAKENETLMPEHN